MLLVCESVEKDISYQRGRTCLILICDFILVLIRVSSVSLRYVNFEILYKSYILKVYSTITYLQVHIVPQLMHLERHIRAPFR